MLQRHDLIRACKQAVIVPCSLCLLASWRCFPGQEGRWPTEQYTNSFRTESMRLTAPAGDAAPSNPVWRTIIILGTREIFALDSVMRDRSVAVPGSFSCPANSACTATDYLLNREMSAPGLPEFNKSAEQFRPKA